MSPTKLKMNHQEKDLSIEEAFEKFIRKCKINNLTELSISTYEKKIGKFRLFFNFERKVTDVTENIVENYIHWLKEENSCNDITINSYIRNLRAFLYFCMDKGYIPKFKIKLIKAEKKIKQIYSDSDLEKLLEKPDMDSCSFSTYKIWVLENYLLGTGNRISTAVNVKIGDLDFDNNLITLRKVKNRKQQIIPMSSALSKILIEYLEIRGGTDGDYLFCNEYGERATIKSIQDLVRKYNIKRGVSITSCHAFRHTFGTKWCMNNGNVAQLSKIMGHSSLSVTNEYLQMAGKDLSTNFDKFNPLDNLESNKDRKKRL